MLHIPCSTFCGEAVLGNEPGPWHVLGKYSTTEIYALYKWYYNISLSCNVHLLQKSQKILKNSKK